MPKRFVTCEIHYDQDAGDPFIENDQLGTLVIHNRHAPRQVHEEMRGVKVAVRVLLPPSYTDRNYTEGFVYMTPDEVRKEYGSDSVANREKAQAALLSEAREWRAWADGNSFGYILKVEEECPCCGQRKPVDQEHDSCWGFTTADPETDLLEWMGDGMDAHGKEALALALQNLNGGGYPVAARATIEYEHNDTPAVNESENPQ